MKTKTIIQKALEAGKYFLSVIVIISLVLLLCWGSVTVLQWKRHRASSRQIAHKENAMYISADSGYYAKLETTTYLYGDGDTITTRSLSLTPAHTNTFFVDSTGFQEIRVWDVENDGKWDRVFLCGYPTQDYGCNSIILKKGNWSDWTYEPCGYDEKKPTPFTERVIAHLRALIAQF